MGTSRVDFYTKVHKGLRASLFRLSQQAGSIDYAQPEAAVSLSQSLEAVLGQLTAHAGHEEKFIHPLLSRKLDANPFDAEHARLEAEQRRLAVLMREVLAAPGERRRPSGLALYRALNVFIARYLEHLEGEERMMTVLWERCTDEELVAVLAAFGASRPVEEALADIGWILPALSASEQAEMIAGMSAALSRQGNAP